MERENLNLRSYRAKNSPKETFVDEMRMAIGFNKGKQSFQRDSATSTTSTATASTSMSLRGSLEPPYEGAVPTLEETPKTQELLINSLQAECQPVEVFISPKLITNDKYKYIGNLNSEGKREGFGICHYKNGDIYSGNWVNDKKSGWGRYEFKSSGKIFRGEFKENDVDGYVEYITRSGVVHQGLMKHMKFVNNEAMIITHPKYELQGVMAYNPSIGKLEGLAKIKYKNGTIYEGQIVDNCETGWGTTLNVNGTKVKGLKNEGKLDGYCEVYHPSEEKFFGCFKSDKRHGLGICYATGLYSVGKWLDDFKDGGFITLSKGEVKFDLYLCGFLTKTIEKKENIISYLNVCYPEYKWLYAINNKALCELVAKQDYI